MCGSNTLYIDNKDAICKECGFIIKNYKNLKLFLGQEEFKKFEKGMYKHNHKEKI